MSEEKSEFTKLREKLSDEEMEFLATHEPEVKATPLIGSKLTDIFPNGMYVTFSADGEVTGIWKA